MVTLCFRPASELPDDDTSVLCADEECVWVGYHRGGMWYDVSGNEWPGVRAWADLPDAGECLSALERHE